MIQILVTYSQFKKKGRKQKIDKLSLNDKHNGLTMLLITFNKNFSFKHFVL